MKIPVLSLAGQKVSEAELPAQFSESVRPDLIKRAALAAMSSKFQPYGADPLAGKRQGKAWSKRRHKYGTTYGIGISRVARKALWKRGSRFGWVGAFVAQTVGGMKAFPPKVEKNIVEKINKKEKRKAIRSAIAASANLELVSSKHKLGKLKVLPVVLEDAVEKLNKAKQVHDVLKALGLEEELNRIREKRMRAGKGKMRGRKYKAKVGPLFVVAKNCQLEKAAANLPGIKVVPVKNLNAALLAPGAQPARLTIWSKAALETLHKEKLFT